LFFWFSVIFSFFYIVSPGEVGVEVLFGKVQKYSEAGLRVKAPRASVITFDIKTHRENFKAEGMSKDMQLVVIESAVNFRIDFTRISDLYTKVGRDYITKVVEPAIHQAIKASSARFNVEEITVNRDKLKLYIEDELTTKLSNYYVVLQDVNLVDIDFSPEFNKILEEKQIEQQKIKTAEYRKQQAEQAKQQVILEAQAEGEKQRLLRLNTSREVIELKWIEKWDGKLPQVSGSGNSGMLVDIRQK
jgi:regulator of protease activity HflC (stomatin/prohibitin superfamily)